MAIGTITVKLLDLPQVQRMHDELQRIRTALGCTEGPSDQTDPVALIDMLRSWEVDASRRADRLQQHLLAVLEIARTWQPGYATRMDRDTLDLAAAEVGHVALDASGQQKNA